MWDGKIDRSLCKRSVMTTPYGATSRGFVDQLLVEVNKNPEKFNIDRAVLFKACTYLARVLQKAINQVIIASKDVMDWLKSASKIFNQENKPTIWTVPTGFKPMQRYKKYEEIRIEHFLVKRLRFILGKDTDKLNTLKQLNGISPNIVHSMDAAHLVKTVNALSAKGITSFAMIHDSFGCHASDCDILSRTLREEFVKIYSHEDVLFNLREEFLSQIKDQDLKDSFPELPEMGTLNIEEVLQSRYFFS